MRRIARWAFAAIVSVAFMVSVVDAQRHGGRRTGAGLSFGGLCGSAETIGNGLSAIEVMVTPTPEQQLALDELKAVAKLNADAMAAACTDGYPGTLPGRLAASEKRLEATLAGIRRLQPALDKFYATLSDAQKSEVSGLLILPGV
jgi:LTXXQ motif family protein